jgi:uncharacterized protein (DUF433 family)
MGSDEDETADKRLGEREVAPGIMRNPAKVGGVPTIGRYRLQATTPLDNLAGGLSIDEYFEQFPPPPTLAETLCAFACGAQLARDIPRSIPALAAQVLERLAAGESVDAVLESFPALTRWQVESVDDLRVMMWIVEYIPVADLPEKLAADPSIDDVVAGAPSLTREDVLAAIDFAKQLMRYQEGDFS